MKSENSIEDLYYVFWADPKDPKGGQTDNNMDRPMYYNTTYNFSEL